MNKPAFLVSGMPRSRTAWMAAWLTTDKTICYHDPKIGEVDATLSTTYRRTGFSGPEVCTMFKQYPDVPWLLVFRAHEQALPEFIAIAQQHGVAPADVQKFWFERFDYLQEISKNPTMMLVRFEDLNDIEAMRKVWHHLMPDEIFDLARYVALNRLIITQDTRK
jgi:hypothetical protein